MKTRWWGWGELTALLAGALLVGGAGAPVAPAAETDPDAVGFRAMMNNATGRMHEGMHVPFTGDADRDFARMMIPHHQGAIDMAKAELTYGKDPVMRRLAEEIIVDQQSEITAMQLRINKNAAFTAKEK